MKHNSISKLEKTNNKTIFHEHRCKNLPRNIIKLNLAYRYIKCQTKIIFPSESIASYKQQ